MTPPPVRRAHHSCASRRTGSRSSAIATRTSSGVRSRAPNGVGVAARALQTRGQLRQQPLALALDLGDGRGRRDVEHEERIRDALAQQVLDVVAGGHRIPESKLFALQLGRAGNSSQISATIARSATRR